ncbi:lectin subunit alpha-like isoform X1 [Rhynchophorus ferrugineus]|uniref:lectin subunit alpha-like isoform X1 n=2 Tax=Rhynchophorus ferrugineus TaxID=354439 RepID=UPI003FCD251A
MGFHNAFITCRQYGFEPAEIHTIEEHIMVEKLLKHEKVGYEHGFWIFATNLDDKHSYYWLNSGRRLFYSNFSQGQPDNYKDNESCLQVFPVSSGHFAWNDLPCSLKMPFLCQHYQKEKNQETCEDNRVSSC